MGGWALEKLFDGYWTPVKKISKPLGQDSPTLQHWFYIESFPMTNPARRENCNSRVGESQLWRKSRKPILFTGTFVGKHLGRQKQKRFSILCVNPSKTSNLFNIVQSLFKKYECSKIHQGKVNIYLVQILLRVYFGVFICHGFLLCCNLSKHITITKSSDMNT